MLAKYGAEGQAEGLALAEQAFRRALEIDPDLPVAHNFYTYFEIEEKGRASEAMVRLLERVKAVAIGDAFDGGDGAAFSFDAEYEAGGNDAAVEYDGASAAIAVVAAFLCAGEVEDVAEAFEEALARLAQELDGLSVDGSAHADFFV